MTVATLPAGTMLQPLEAHADERGVFTELYRREWGLGAEPVQWNAVWSEAGVLRGVHVHLRHDDYLTVPVGRASVGLRDLRHGSPSEGLTAVVELGREQPGALVIPRGSPTGSTSTSPRCTSTRSASTGTRPTSWLATGPTRSSGSTGHPLRPWSRIAIGTLSRCRRCSPS